VKSILRSIVFYSAALYLTSQAIDGVNVAGGLSAYLMGGIILSLLFIIIKPILSIVTLPLRIITLGLFSFLINVIIVYVLTIVAPNVSVSSFVFEGFSFIGFVIPRLAFNTFFAFIIVSLFITIIVDFFKWLIKK